MKSNKQRAAEITSGRRVRRLKDEERDIQYQLDHHIILPVDRSKVHARSALPQIPKYYRDMPFACIDCGREEVWTASQQKWWYETARGDWEQKAVRCRTCRQKEQTRKALARSVHVQGLQMKKSRAELAASVNGRPGGGRD